MACLEFDCTCGEYWANNGPGRYQYCPVCGRKVHGDFDEPPDLSIRFNRFCVFHCATRSAVTKDED